MKRVPLSLKILSVFLSLWALMTLMVIFKMPEREIVIFGYLFSKDLVTYIVPILVDIVAPIIFIFTVFKRLSWGLSFGLIYNGIFILNNLIAVFTHREHFGNGIFFPLILSTIFFITIFAKREFFRKQL